MTRNPDVFTIREAAAFLGAHEQTVRRLARRHAIPAFKVGKDWRFRREALLRWAEEQHAPATDKGLTVVDRGTPGSVLIIDDDERVRRWLARIVEGFGCRARQAASGAEGLELVAQAAPDLILLDLVMPDINGPAFLEELRKTHVEVPVVIVTGYPDGELMRQAAQHAPLMMLPKPVDRTLLERTVRVALGKGAGRRAPERHGTREG